MTDQPTYSQSRRAQRQAKIRAAMPDVQKLVAQFGAKTVSICLRRAQRHEAEFKRLEILRRETANIEKRVFG